MSSNPAARSHEATSYLDAVRGEWTKLRTLRSSAYLLTTLALVIIVLTVLVSGGVAETYDQASASERAGLDHVGGVLFVPLVIGQLAIMVLAALSMTAEHATGTIAASLAAVPRRGRLLAAKATVLALVAFAAGQTTGLLAFAVGQVVLVAGDVPAADLSQPQLWRALGGTGVYLTLVALLAVAVGVLLRATAGAIFTMVGVAILLPQILPAVLPQRLGEWVANYWPTNAGMAMIFQQPDPGNVWAPLQGFAVLAGTVIVMLVAAWTVLARRDAR
jgi:ABC-2 type transport system permease protein